MALSEPSTVNCQLSTVSVRILRRLHCNSCFTDLLAVLHRLSSERRVSRLLFTNLHPLCLHSELKSYCSLCSILGLSTNKWCNPIASVARLHGTLHEQTGKCIADYLTKRLLLRPFAVERKSQRLVQAVLILAGQCDWHLESPENETLSMCVTPFLVSYSRLTRYSARSPGHGFVYLQLHAHAGLMCSIKALCNPSTPNFPVGTFFSASESIILEIFMLFTIVTAMIPTAFATSLVRDSARDRRYTIGDHRRSLVVRVVEVGEVRYWATKLGTPPITRSAQPHNLKLVHKTLVGNYI